MKAEIFLNELLNYGNYKKTINKLRDAGWENSYFKSDDVSMIGHGCVVSSYPQFYDHKMINRNLPVDVQDISTSPYITYSFWVVLLA